MPHAEWKGWNHRARPIQHWSASHAAAFAPVTHAGGPDSSPAIGPSRWLPAKGETVEGIAKNEDEFSVQLLDFHDKLHLYDTTELREITHGKVSLMPHDYDKVLTPDEYQDLLAMLAKQVTTSLQHKTRRRGRGGALNKNLWILLLLGGAASPLSAQVTDKQLLQQPDADWLTYNGSYNTERHSELKQITLKNVGSSPTSGFITCPAPAHCSACPSWSMA